MGYDRQAAVAYAERWWNGQNPQFRFFAGNDCANYVSQAMLAGGLAMEHADRREKGWWYRGPHEQWSFSWSVAHSLHLYLQRSKRGYRQSDQKGLEPGDLILYDWKGDGVWGHVAIVVSYSQDGEPLVAAHTNPIWAHPWRLTDSPAYTPATRYGCWHITGAS